MDNKRAILQQISKYYPSFVRFFKVRYVKYTTQQLEELGTIIKSVSPNFRLNLTTGCGGCITEAITILSNYYDREIKNYPDGLEDKQSEPEQPPVVEAEQPTEPQQETVSVEAETPKKKRKSYKIKDDTTL